MLICDLKMESAAKIVGKILSQELGTDFVTYNNIE
jgi:hypothetical protein